MWCFVVPAKTRLDWGENQTTSKFLNQGSHAQIMLVSQEICVSEKDMVVCSSLLFLWI